MKKTLLSLSVLTLALSGCSKDPEPVNTPPSANEQSSQNEQSTNNQNIFTQEDIDKAIYFSNKTLAIITSIDGKTLLTSEDLKAAQTDLSDQLKELGIMHEESHVLTPDNTIYRDNTGKIILPLADFKIKADQTSETYYEYINTHVLEIPFEYKATNGVLLDNSLTFVKTMDNQVQLSNTLMVSGPKLEKKDEEASYDTYNREKLQDEVKEMNIQ